MKIQQPVDETFWWEVARQCEYATFFHTPLWHKLATMTFLGHKDVSVGAILENGVCLVLPLLQAPSRFPLLHVRTSTYATCYGGIIANGPTTPGGPKELYKKLGSPQTSRLHVVSNPYANQVIPSDRFTHQSCDTTHVLPLNADFEILFSLFSKSVRNNIHKGKRLGVRVRTAVTLADYQTYYAVYQQSLQRWGETTTSRYPWDLFENGYLLSQSYPGLMRLWLAEVDAQVIAGAWVFYWNGFVNYWHGATNEDFFEYRAANVLHATIIQNAAAEKQNYYDFNPSGGHAGVAEFKKRFGCQTRELTHYVYEHPIRRMAQRIRRIY